MGWNSLVVLLRHVDSEEDEGQNKAQRTNYDVTDREEVVLTSKEVSSRNYEGFRARETISVVCVQNL